MIVFSGCLLWWKGGYLFLPEVLNEWLGFLAGLNLRSLVRLFKKNEKRKVKLMQEKKRQRILLGVSGGISAYKIPVLVRLLITNGFEVQILLTKKAKKFVSPVVLETLTGRTAITSLFSKSVLTKEDGWTKHIHISEWADMFVLAPATANTIAKMAHGFANDPVSLFFMAFGKAKPRLIVPAMDGEMFNSAFVQRNIEVLRSDGVCVLNPEFGELASGLVGLGRMPEPQTIFTEIQKKTSICGNKWKGKKVLVTAGATREKIDPVRFISNFSTGKMGYAFVSELLQHSVQKVILVTGKTNLKKPEAPNVLCIEVESAEEMYKAVSEHFSSVDVFISTAAVSDFKPKVIYEKKQKKTSMNDIVIELSPTIDILREMGLKKINQQVLVGFSLETEYNEQNAIKKMVEKNCDAFILNVLSRESGFETNTNKGTMIFKDGSRIILPLMTKRDMAAVILDHVLPLIVGNK
ncbi:hypothetical protein CHS0354_000553 [Potamilus streckersoni]|uniref:Phosphopantothenoylcysteine decarboxylase n=1 Tax=Potamilus streckersoni TaxID=2493646 RepID=A0AAE0W980_9BIVA|nr:hypothetical protein CHS0354_000553 [Potamilus streckersoni]